MNAGEFVAVALAGGLGAGIRLLVDEAVQRRVRSEVPWGLVAVNLSGSLALGCAVGLAVGLAPEAGQMLVSIVGVGFLGGYTTFSTASVATVQLAARRRFVAALVTGPGMLIAAIACAALGWAGASLV